MVRITDRERIDILEKTIADFQHKGWVVENQREFSANMVKHAQGYSCLLMLLIGLFALLFPRTDEHVLIEVNVLGKVILNGYPASDRVAKEQSDNHFISVMVIVVVSMLIIACIVAAIVVVSYNPAYPI
jgi:uncharacterized Tic20 family protein